MEQNGTSQDVFHDRFGFGERQEGSRTLPDLAAKVFLRTTLAVGFSGKATANAKNPFMVATKNDSISACT